ncbi:hypothetical protein AVEN_19578-1 [Araneus ventricosus]|uniref:DUF4371 domain-containing protein n=1 Tax=Araneus ventricosus TaxID=182803 RepID=A0A4Y2J2R2_ARAVE|nr:hypothetical protein AVEN_19578-1 [Araneus ventricosus]
MSQIIRYVNIKDGEESFVDFVISHQRKGRNLSEEIMQKLSSDGLDVQNCRGQGLNDGSNMAGKYEGVQVHIFKIKDFAKFVRCAEHSLNLVGRGSVSSDDEFFWKSVGVFQLF